LALFFKNQRGFFYAFNKLAPNRYLAEEQKGQHEGLSGMVVGRIVLVEDYVAGPKDSENPYRLAVGTKFYKLYIELKDILALPEVEMEAASLFSSSTPSASAVPGQAKK